MVVVVVVVVEVVVDVGEPPKVKRSQNLFVLADEDDDLALAGLIELQLYLVGQQPPFA